MHPALDVSHAQNFKPHNDKSEGSNDDSKFDAFAKEFDNT